MQNRRDFIRSAAALTGGAFAMGTIPDAIARAIAINPAPGTTFRDAEHVVILMQENRSFDHSYGALQGVRGFRDPRAHVQPNGNRVWFQADEKGATYAPFRLDITGTNATWIGGLPHTWPDQIDARNGGRYDKWLIAKPRRDLPFTLGHYTRTDIPFYYAFADAFTVCDQAFCSSLTGTTANRLFLWTGAIRRDARDVPRVMNDDTVYDKEASWPTFPERLEDAGVSWKIYQNEVSIPTGLTPEEDSWLGSFGDNPLEWFTQYNIRFATSRRAYLPKFVEEAPAELAKREAALTSTTLTAGERRRLETEVAHIRREMMTADAERAKYTDAAWNAVAARAKSLHQRAFAVNSSDPAHRAITKLSYDDAGTAREVSVPAGDVLHQFRADVANGSLPAVSWVVAPQNFSDHPSSAWFGAWYVSEALNILTKNPEVWKKTVFILCYDENDGYFDHVPPFVAPHPTRAETGKASAGIDTTMEWGNVHGRESAIGLGYRVPLVIASPWSRGGAVNSQVFDHTSIIQFVERWLGAKGKRVNEPNISAWRRLVSGDLTSAFRPYDGENIETPSPLGRDATVERIHAARFKQPPPRGVALSQDDIAHADVGALQETGTRPSCPLPYELVVNAEHRGGALALTLEARNHAFGAASEGAAFNAYSYGSDFGSRSNAVRAGDALHDAIPIGGAYHVRVDGPNGFMREFVGDANDGVSVVVDHADGRAASGMLEIRLTNRGKTSCDVLVRDESYGTNVRRISLKPMGTAATRIDANARHGWYDFSIRANTLTYRYAGRVETGKWSITDPAMAGDDARRNASG